MREIKFRAWLPNVKAFFYWGVGDICGTQSFFTGPPSNPDAVHQQYTGLKDARGVEIYEGDIVSTAIGKDSIEGVIKYAISEFGIDWTHHYSLLGSWGQRHGLRRLADSLLPEELTVIGNIYENPELLEANNAATSV